MKFGAGCSLITLEAVVFWRFETVDHCLVDDIADGPPVVLRLAGDQIDACEWHSMVPFSDFSRDTRRP